MADRLTFELARDDWEAELGLDLAPLFALASARAADPRQAMLSLWQWLKATTSPRMQAEELLARPDAAARLIAILGASQVLADNLRQNPELASLILDESELPKKPTLEGVREEGESLVKTANSFSHALDRLRFLRQKWTLTITANDLLGLWPPETVWRAISTLAEALIGLTLDAVWRNGYAASSGLPECPVVAVAFGKLGGEELNYSSDIDLAWVLPDGLSETVDRLVTKFCEAAGRALSDRMGRGALYRVDLRLRPYGGSGPLTNSFAAVESYYQRYAETWELQALIRSRVVYGDFDARARWESLRIQRAFPESLNEFALEQLLESRTRTEAIAEAGDLKRGAGGIRDAEFAVQALQMANGHAVPEARVRPTLAATSALADAGALAQTDAQDIREAYTFLRQVEHRLQLNDQQTHTLPKSPEARERLALVAGFSTWADLEAAIEHHRGKLADLFRRLFLKVPTDDRREEALGRLGAVGFLAAAWIDSLSGSEEFYRALADNAESAERTERILRRAPALIPELRDSPAITELILSGEIEEESAPARLKSLSIETPLNRVAKLYRAERLRIAAKWALEPDFELEEALSELASGLVVHVARRLSLDFSILALGALARHEMSLGSDADLYFLLADAGRHEDAERQAQDLLALVSSLRRLGAPIEIDLRLRPEGRQGLLVRTYQGLRAYDLEGMEMWERFALGQARFLFGDPDSRDFALKIAYAQPLTPERLRELLAIKKRIETERVQPKYLKRDLKLGHGGLGDLEWFVHIYEMRYPTATQAGTRERMDDRIGALCAAGLINAVEAEELRAARVHLLNLRHRLAFHGAEGSILPENPDKLAALAEELGERDGNALLARHERIVDTVRLIFNEGMERLKA